MRIRPRLLRLGHAAAVVFAIGVVMCASGLAQAMPMNAKQCQELGEYMERVADVRDLGAMRELHIALVKRKNTDLSRPTLQLLEREIRRVYAAPWRAPDQVATDVYTRCMTGALTAKES